MKFSQKDINRSIRDFDTAIRNLRIAGFQVYQARTVELINLIKTNQILNVIVGPYLKMKVDYNEIFPNRNGFLLGFHLPTDEVIQTAYVLQVMDEGASGKEEVEDHAFSIYQKSSMDENLRLWNDEILFPCLTRIMQQLEDLIEDEVAGKSQVESSNLQIFNYGSITATNGNVAVGNDISQTISTNTGVSDEIIKMALKQNAIESEQVPVVKEITDEIQTELQNESPSQGKLKDLAGKLFDIGNKGLLNAANNVINDPQWSSAVTTYLMGLIS
ncbi:hypothetical protein [Bacillus wiedmannii]|uniref:hypothetical protein n=1 Tax=Bacillus wiedmannii TaxID=1890302 RepID=UPI002E233792|nr:hypothetical protein [Bacillus wiedmannii]